MVPIVYKTTLSVLDCCVILNLPFMLYNVDQDATDPVAVLSRANAMQKNKKSKGVSKRKSSRKTPTQSSLSVVQ